jgi:hypothetical protein
LRAHDLPSVAAHFNRRQGVADPTLIELETIARFIMAGTARHMEIIETLMPRTASSISKDVLAFESLAHYVRALQIFTAYRAKKERLEDRNNQLHLVCGTIANSAQLIRDLVSELKSPSWASLWWARRMEFAKIQEPEELFSAHRFCLGTAKGHSLPAVRYDPSPPVLLDLDFSMESMPLELACLREMEVIIDTLVEIVSAFPDPLAFLDEPDDEVDREIAEMLSEKPALPSSLETIEGAAVAATKGGDPVQNMRSLLKIAIKAAEFVRPGEETTKRNGELQLAIAMLERCTAVDQFLAWARANFK